MRLGAFQIAQIISKLRSHFTPFRFPSTTARAATSNHKTKTIAARLSATAGPRESVSQFPERVSTGVECKTIPRYSQTQVAHVQINMRNILLTFADILT